MFAPAKNAGTEQLAAAANAALRAETHNIGVFELAGTGKTVTIEDPRCGAGRHIILIPLNAQAANARWHQESMARGAATLVFTEEPPPGARFAYAIVGVGTPQGEYHGPVTQSS